jgi:hypothetical protein
MVKPASILVIGLALSAAACSLNSTSSGDDGPTGPVASSPLTGSIDGKDFTAKSAVARKGFDDGKKSIDIYDTDVTCDTFDDKAERKILIDVPWTAGTTKDFSFSLSSGSSSQTATFVIDKGGTPDNIIATTGRVEIIDAPTDKGTTGKMRLRAIAQGNKVEGEIPVQVCE